MKDASPRQMMMSVLLRQLGHARPVTQSPSIVFAPHQDDETLGCGGMIAQKRREGVPVWIVFMTDGSRSHQRYLNKEDVSALRAQEARNAARLLGVAEENVCFLQFPNGGLSLMQVEAQRKVEDILLELHPQEIYLPSPLDFHAEHRVTAQIVYAAINALSARRLLSPLPVVYEYPVWFWYQWPWVALPEKSAAQRQILMKRGLRYGFGAAFLTHFRHAILIRDVLPLKREALAAYTSQTQRLNQEVDWPTLQDVAGGAFLDCFFHDVELFHHNPYLLRR